MWSAEPDPTTATPPGSVPILDIDALLEELHFPRTSHTQAASSNSRSVIAFNWAVWFGPDAAA